MKFRNRLGVVIAVVLVAVGGLVFMGVQNVKAADVDGTASNITSTSMTVGNKTLVIDSNTEIVGQLVSGSIVQIRAKVQDDNTLLATRIVVKNNNDDDMNDDDDDDEIEGIIAEYRYRQHSHQRPHDFYGRAYPNRRRTSYSGR